MGHQDRCSRQRISFLSNTHTLLLSLSLLHTHNFQPPSWFTHCFLVASVTPHLTSSADAIFLFLSSFPPTLCPFGYTFSHILPLCFVFLLFVSSLCHFSPPRFPAPYSFFAWVPEQQKRVREPLIMAALTTIEGDVWQDETCVCVCMHVGILMGEEILPVHWIHLGHWKQQLKRDRQTNITIPVK